jgi:hypothetical protein
LLLTLFLAGLGSPPVAWAASGDGYTICGQNYDPNNTFAWEKVEARYAGRVENKQYKAVVVALRAEFLASANQADPNLRDRFDSATSRLESAFPAQCSDFTVFKNEGGESLGVTTYTLFAAEPSESIVLNADCNDGARVTQTQEMRHLVDSLRELCGRALTDTTGQAAERIEAIETRFDRYLFEGFPMFPWEALANSCFLSKKHLADGPPRNQLMLIHPVAGVIVKTSSFAEASPDLALGVDLLGWIHYPKRYDYRSWFGASAMASVADDRGTGLGVAFQWDNFRLAVVYHDDDSDGTLFDDHPSVFLGLDLYHFVKEKYRSYASYRAKLRDLEKPTQ